jgi:hypothetical protein
MMEWTINSGGACGSGWTQNSRYAQNKLNELKHLVYYCHSEKHQKVMLKEKLHEQDMEILREAPE